MSDKDNPFGSSGGDRTVFQPNPGGRRPPPRPAAPPPPAPPTPGYTPQTAPAYAPQQDFGAPRPAEHPYGQFAPSPFETASAPRAPAPDAWVTGRGQQQQAAAPLQRAEDLDFDALVAQHPNPILRAAGPLLHLLGRLRVAALSADLESLLEQVAAAVAFFDKDIRSAGVTPEQANVAKYLICATADDIVQNIPTDDRHLWTRYSMTSRFFGERLGGVNFFKQLEWLQRDPSANFDVLELQHVCLALGFQGQYRAAEGGPNQLQYIQRNLYELLRRVRPKQVLDLSPRWKGQALPLGRKGFVLPVWASAAVATLLLFGVFIGLRAKLGGIGESVAAEIETLHPSTKIALQERLNLPRVEPPPKPSVQCKRIGEQVGDGVSVTCNGKWVQIKVGDAVLFQSGKAAVLPQFSPIAERIARAIEGETGPIKVIGHTDNQPLSPLNPFRDNQRLSEERARAVAALLKPLLKDPSRVSEAGRGPSEPIADNANEAGRRLNRRVEVLISRID
ncbi:MULTISPECIES: type IVB secretion system protein IcmH/DotU [unclassified Methylosinus]|uniref:type IVB secretion system protein IcmH/DotU n=1 Tax=unclassified Methylosinus TaxID=2624500 RepID=UPI000463A44C|nr:MULTISPECIES: type IVB secretion system protein IcmH/DotU [unclassified Methylosinus]